jgi:hypothetical protein
MCCGWSECLTHRLVRTLCLQVLLDGGSIKAKLEENRFFAKPRLALDAVGGTSAVAIADALQDGCPLVMCAHACLACCRRAHPSTARA